LGDANSSDLANSDGAKLVGGIGFVSPEMFGYLQGVSPDAVPYYQKLLMKAMQEAPCATD
jgi:hypothetical protein